MSNDLHLALPCLTGQQYSCVNRLVTTAVALYWRDAAPPTTVRGPRHCLRCTSRLPAGILHSSRHHSDFFLDTLLADEAAILRALSASRTARLAAKSSSRLESDTPGCRSPSELRGETDRASKTSRSSTE